MTNLTKTSLAYYLIAISVLLVIGFAIGVGTASEKARTDMSTLKCEER